MKVKIISLLILFSNSICGQSINVLKSLRAPVDIKINGKLDEWGEKNEVFNPATELYYALANDDENIYIAAKTNNIDVINKIVAGGLSFIVPNSGRKNDKSTRSVIFPAYDTQDRKGLHRLDKRTANFNPQQFILDNNVYLQKNCKLIHLKSSGGLDSLVSIYNDAGFKAACFIDTEKNLNIEIAIPINYISSATTSNNRFSFHIVLAGAKPKDEIKSAKLIFADGHAATQAEIDKMKSKIMYDDSLISTPTDFWGEYTLAK